MRRQWALNPLISCILVVTTASCFPWLLPCHFLDYRLEKIGDSIYFLDRSLTLYGIGIDGKLEWKKKFDYKGEIDPIEVTFGSCCKDKVVIILDGIYIVDKQGNIVRKYNYEEIVGKNHSVKDVTKLGRNLILETENEFLYFGPEEDEILWHMKKERIGRYTIWIPTSVTSIVFRVDLADDSSGIIFKVKIDDGTILSERNIRCERGKLYLPSSYFYQISDCLYGEICIFPYPSTYVWLECALSTMEEEIELLGINVETLDVLSSVKIVPKFDVTHLIRKIIIFQDRIIIYTEFNHDEGNIISAVDIDGLKWRRSIKWINFLFPLESEIVAMDYNYKSLIFFSPLNGEIIRQENTDIKMNLDIGDKYGEDIIGNFLDIESAELYLLWMKGDRRDEKRKEKGLLKLDLRNGRTIWNIQLDFVEPKCIKM